MEEVDMFSMPFKQPLALPNENHSQLNLCYVCWCKHKSTIPLISFPFFFYKYSTHKTKTCNIIPKCYYTVPLAVPFLIQKRMSENFGLYEVKKYK
jgi:hypothetical protein